MLRLSDLDEAADQLLGRLVAHAGGRLDDDVAVLLFEARPAPVRLAEQAAASPAPAWTARSGADLLAAAERS